MHFDSVVMKGNTWLNVCVYVMKKPKVRNESTAAMEMRRSKAMHTLSTLSIKQEKSSLTHSYMCARHKRDSDSFFLLLTHSSLSWSESSALDWPFCVRHGIVIFSNKNPFQIKFILAYTKNKSIFLTIWVRPSKSAKRQSRTVWHD